MMFTILMSVLALHSGVSVEYPGPGFMPEFYKGGLQVEPDLNCNGGRVHAVRGAHVCSEEWGETFRMLN